jgi:hypothetical protein
MGNREERKFNGIPAYPISILRKFSQISLSSGCDREIQKHFVKIF